jgi:hypothetical protein
MHLIINNNLNAGKMNIGGILMPGSKQMMRFKVQITAQNPPIENSSKLTTNYK